MPYTSSEPSRPLEFPLYNSADVSEDQTEDTDASQIVWTNPDNDERVFVVLNLSLNEYIALASAIDVGRDIAYPADSHRVWWIWIRSFVTMDLCEYIQSCIGAQLNEIQGGLNNIQADVDQLQLDVADLRANQNTQAPQSANVGCADDVVYGGALELVRAMDRENRRLYAEAEIADADNVAEWADIIIEGVPGLGVLPFDEIAALANWYFANQVAEYEADYSTTLEEDMAKRLMCFIQANDCVLDYQTWGDWLVDVGTQHPTNVAAQLYARYAPAAQSLANALVELADPDSIALSEYFDTLYRQYGVGAQDPITPPEEPACPAPFGPILQLLDATCFTGSPEAVGTNLQLNEVWEADGTTDAITNTRRVCLMEAEGRPFQFNTFTSSVTIGGAVWVQAATPTVCEGGAGQFPPDDTPLLGLIWVITENGTPLHVGFNFFE